MPLSPFSAAVGALGASFVLSGLTNTTGISPENLFIFQHAIFDFEKFIRPLHIFCTFSFIHTFQNFIHTQTYSCPVGFTCQTTFSRSLRDLVKEFERPCLERSFHLYIREFVISHQQARPPFIQDGSIRGSDYKTCRYAAFYFRRCVTLMKDNIVFYVHISVV